MTLELLPAVDVADGQAVRLVQGELGSETAYGSPLDAALQWQTDGAEWIHLVDLDAAFGTGSNRELLADVVGRLDVRGTTLAARGWTQEGGELFDVLGRLDRDGCARYVVTDVGRDGTMTGPNLELLRSVCAATDRPVVASGGVSSLADLRAIAATEAQRLRDAAAMPAYERRDLLDDLASRLSVLLGSVPGDEFAPLRELIVTLGGEKSLDEKWATALATLTAFGGGAAPTGGTAGGTTGGTAGGTSGGTKAPAPEQPSRKHFWKR